MNLDIKHTTIFTKNLESKSRIVINQGGTRSSKTYSLAQLFCYKLLTEKNIVIDVVRKTFPALRDSAMRDFFSILKDLNLYNPVQHNKSNNFYTIDTNAIYFFSVDDSQKIRGRKRHYLWINESNELSREDWRQLSMRTEKQIYLDFNPSVDETHWIYDEVVPREDTTFIKSTYLDNPFLGDEIVNEIQRLKSLDPSYWKVYGLGDRADLKTGLVFPKDNYSEYDVLPKDIKSVIYCDPNLAIKGKGDTTAIVHLGYSAYTDEYYILDAVSQSFSDSTELLNTVFLLKSPTTIGIGFDGHVSQESTWTNFVKNWAKLHDAPFYRIEYKRYFVDDLSKNVQLAWTQNKIKFPPAFKDNVANKRFLAQLFSFTNKKAGNPDDAPDALICAFEYIHERGIIKQANKNTFTQPLIMQQTW